MSFRWLVCRFWVPLDVARPAPDVVHTAERLTRGLTTDRERALALYRFVRDDIAFGFTPDFDMATPSATLVHRRGHCNPKAALFASLLNSVHLEARVRFFTIANDVLRGVFTQGTPERLSHAVVEVKLDGAFLPLDGHVTDRPLFDAARARLAQEGRQLGYGAHRGGDIEWDGRTSCWSQLVDRATMALGEHGAYTDLMEFYGSDAYAQRRGLIGGLAFRLIGVSDSRRNLERVRAGG
jgi:hypothetical protein